MCILLSIWQRLKKLEDLLQGQLSGEEEGGDSDGPAPIQAGKAEPVEVDVTESERRERLAAQLTMEEEMRQAAEKTKEVGGAVLVLAIVFSDTQL